MGYSQIHALPTITSYKRAEDYFKATERPKRSKHWQDDELRPLKDTRSTHYALRRHEVWCPDTDKRVIAYTLMLYDTPTITYLPPTQWGERVVGGCRHHANSSTTRAWVHHHSPINLWGATARGADGKSYMCFIPWGTDGVSPISKCSATFDVLLRPGPSRTILTERSWHTPIYRIKSSESDNDFRARKREAWLPICRMAAMGAEQDLTKGLTQRCKQYGGFSFSISDLPARDYIAMLERDLDDGQRSVATRQYQRLLNSTVSYALSTFWKAQVEQERARPRPGRYESEVYDLVFKRLQKVTYVDYETMGVTAEYIARGMAREIVTYYYRNQQSARIPLPQFPRRELVKGRWMLVPE